MRRVETLADRQALAAALVTHVCEEADRAIAARGEFHLALAGGSTPRDAYLLLAEDPCRDRVDWSRLHVWFGDERCVPPDHPDSNYRMAAEALLSRVPLHPARIHRMEGERLEPSSAAEAYEAELRNEAPADAEGVPRLDLVLLGIGDDGHTASIFPDLLPRCEGPALVVAAKPAAKPEWRITLTLPALAAARQVTFACAGAAKAPALARILAEPPAEPLLPAARVQPRDGGLLFLLDREAAGSLSG